MSNGCFRCRPDSRRAAFALFACTLLAALTAANAQVVDSGLAINHKLLQPSPICLGVSGQSAKYYAEGGAKGCNKKAEGCFTVAGGFNPCYTGTLGAMVQDEKGTRYILSNWHVFANPPKKDPAMGDAINHVAPTDTAGLPAPSYCDNKSAIPTTVPIPPPVPSKMPYARPFQVGMLSAWIEPKVDSVTVDAAIAAVYNGAASSAILDIPAFRPVPQDPEQYAVVVKSGRTTGITYGVVVEIDSWPPDGSGLINQIVIAPLLPTEPFAEPGDDGALVLQVCNADPGPNVAANVPLLCPVGLIWAFGENLGEDGDYRGYTFANPIKDVIDEFAKKYPKLGKLSLVPSMNCPNKFPF
ncbi:MAG: hypothetical protein ABSD98_11565 [Candidatus Korobacteraceae bacterium]|jgi:hypothetical protein